MGFLSRLFGGKEEKKPEVRADLPIKKARLKGIAQLRLTEAMAPAYKGLREQDYNDRMELRNDIAYTGDADEGALSDAIKAAYDFELEYVVFDEDLLNDNLGGGDPEEDLNELFYVCFSEINSITVKVIEGDSEAYAEMLVEKFNNSCRDWGIEGKRITVKSVAPTEEYREFYEAYRKVWG